MHRCDTFGNCLPRYQFQIIVRLSNVQSVRQRISERFHVLVLTIKYTCQRTQQMTPKADSSSAKGGSSSIPAPESPWRKRRRLQRQVQDSSPPFVGYGTRRDQQEFVNGLANSQSAWKDEHARHRFARRDSFIGEVRHGGAVVGQHDAFSFGCPRKNRGIIGTHQSHILNADEIQVGLAACQATHDFTLEVLICQEPQHGPSLHLRTGEQASPDVT